MEHIFSVAKDDLYKEVAMITGYTGAKLDELGEAQGETPGGYNRISTTDENGDILGRAMENAVAEIETEFSGYLSLRPAEELREIVMAYLPSSRNEPATEPPCTDGLVVIGFGLPESFDRRVLGALDRSVREYIVCRMVYEWFLIAHRGDADIYLAKMNEWMKSMRNSLLKRSRVTTRPLHPY